MSNEDIVWSVCDTCKRDYPVGRTIESTKELVDDGRSMRDWVERLLGQIGGLEEENERLNLENRVNEASIKSLRKDYSLLTKKAAKLKETLIPVLEYGAEIYNRGIPQTEMPADTIQRLNSAFNIFGGRNEND